MSNGARMADQLQERREEFLETFFRKGAEFTTELIDEVQELRDDEVRHVVLDRTDNEDQPIFQQPRVDVVRPLAARRLLDDHRYQVQ